MSVRYCLVECSSLSSETRCGLVRVLAGIVVYSPDLRILGVFGKAMGVVVNALVSASFFTVVVGCSLAVLYPELLISMLLRRLVEICWPLPI